jgi:L-threonylcarbamoyladenylate synthase
MGYNPFLMDLNEQIIKAAELIKSGGIAAFPTETVYGIGAKALESAAVAKIFAIKGRPPQNPLIVHVSSLDQLIDVAAAIPIDAHQLIERFWPGPLTLVFQKKEAVPEIVTAGLDTVAVRMPDHPIALELIRRAGVPLAAPSANPSGMPSSTHHSHVRDYFGDRLFVIEGGDCPIGVESTVLYLQSDPPRILRQGGLAQEEIEAVLGKKIEVFTASKIALSPGMLFRHYSPKAEVLLVDFSEDMGGEITKSIQGELERGRKVGALVSQEHIDKLPSEVYVVNLGRSNDLPAAAAGLYSALIEMDRQGVQVIVAQSFPEEGLGKAIMDRLKRASKK